MNISLLIRENLTLKTLHIEDAEPLFNSIRKNDQHLRQWLGWLDDDKSVDDIKKYIAESIKRADSNESIDFLIWQYNQIIGGVALDPISAAHKKVSLMYWLAEDAQGKGIMLDALKLVIDFIFKELKLNRIEISCAVENIKSSALPKKLGFKLEGISRQANWLYDHFVDLEVYSLLVSEWE